MKMMTEAELKELLYRAYRMGWRKAAEPIDNVPTSIIAWCSEPDEFVSEVDILIDEV